MFDFLAKVPTEIWGVIATAVVGAIGWFGKTGYDAWSKSRLPYKQDRDRFYAVMKALNPADLYYFRNPDYSCISNKPLDGLNEASYAIEGLHKPSYLNQRLAEKERALASSLQTFCNILALKLYPHRSNQNLFTMYWDTFEEFSSEDHRRGDEIKNEILAARDLLITAYEDFRHLGNRLFAERLEKGDANG